MVVLGEMIPVLLPVAGDMLAMVEATVAMAELAEVIAEPVVAQVDMLVQVAMEEMVIMFHMAELLGQVAAVVVVVQPNFAQRPVQVEE
jgi:hypothetical protein